MRQLTIIVSLLCATIAANSQSDWQLNKEKKGIKIYTKKTDSSSFKAIKVEGVFEGTWERLSSILMDIELQEQWVYHSKKAYEVKKISGNEVIYYTETALPWPLNNRDVVVRMKLYHDKTHNLNRVLSVKDADIVPAKKGLVRVPYYKAEWEVKTLAKNKIDIKYVLEVKPGGGLPAWVVNMFISTGPYETFNNLAELLKKN